MDSIYKAHVDYAKEEPAWAHLALSALNAAFTGEYTMMHSIALALQDAYERGERGEPPELPKPPMIFRRSKPAPPPTQIVRRTRR